MAKECFLLARVVKQYMGVVHPTLKVFRAGQTVFKNDSTKLNPALGRRGKWIICSPSAPFPLGFLITISMLLYYN